MKILLFSNYNTLLHKYNAKISYNYYKFFNPNIKT